MADNYANALDVLPRELLVVIQHYHVGHLWVPTPNPNDERDRTILEMKAEGLSGKVIAERIGLSERRVWQILKALREENIDRTS